MVWLQQYHAYFPTSYKKNTGIVSNTHRGEVKSTYCTHTGNFSYHHRVVMRQSVMTQSGVVGSWVFTSFVHSQRNQSLRFRNVTGGQDSCSCWRNVILWSANENRITMDKIQWYDLLVGFIHGNSPSPLYPAFIATLFQKMRETTSSRFVTSCSMNKEMAIWAPDSLHPDMTRQASNQTTAVCTFRIHQEVTKPYQATFPPFTVGTRLH
jgi:hypothetical protein